MNGIRATVITVVVLALATIGFALLQFNGAFSIALSVKDCKSMEVTARQALNVGDLATARYRAQEAEACWAAVGERPEPTPDAPAPDAATPFCQEYLANRPPSEKVSENSYGSFTALSPGLAGQNMESLNTQQALSEGEYRRSIDCMLLVADAVAFEVLPSSTNIDSKIRELETDNLERERIIAELDRVLAQDYTHRVQTMPVGNYEATYALPGGIPLVRKDSSVDRSESFTALVSERKSDGRLVVRRLACGFQQYKLNEQPQASAPEVVQPVDREVVVEERVVEQIEVIQISYPPVEELPAPSPGMDRDEEGRPEVERPKDEDKEQKKCPDGSYEDEHGKCPTNEEPETPVIPDEPDGPNPPDGEEPPGLQPKSDNPDDLRSESDGNAAPGGSVQTEPQPEDDHVVGGGGVVDEPTNDPGSESGITAPDADPAPPVDREVPAPEQGASNPDDNAGNGNDGGDDGSGDLEIVNPF